MTMGVLICWRVICRRTSRQITLSSCNLVRISSATSCDTVRGPQCSSVRDEWMKLGIILTIFIARSIIPQSLNNNVIACQHNVVVVSRGSLMHVGLGQNIADMTNADPLADDSSSRRSNGFISANEHEMNMLQPPNSKRLCLIRCSIKD